MYEVVNNKAPGYLINLFKKKKRNCVYALRENESTLSLPKYNTELAKSRSFSCLINK